MSSSLGSPIESLPIHLIAFADLAIALALILMLNETEFLYFYL